MRMGGMLRAIETGYVQQEIQKSAYEYQQAVERGEQIVVGVNRFQAGEGARFRRCESIPKSSARRWSA